jgi:hypothetical protein
MIDKAQKLSNPKCNILLSELLQLHCTLVHNIYFNNAKCMMMMMMMMLMIPARAREDEKSA